MEEEITAYLEREEKAFRVPVVTENDPKTISEIYEKFKEVLK